MHRQRVSVRVAELPERRGRLILTPAGEVLLAAAYRLIATVEETESAVGQLSGTIAGRAAGLSTAWDNSFTGIAVDFQRLHPRVFLALTYGVLEEFAQQLTAEQIGLAFVARPVQDPRLEAEELTRIERHVYALCRTDHPLAGLTASGPAELLAYPFVYHSPRRSAPVLEHLGLPPHYVIEVDSRLVLRLRSPPVSA